LQILLPGDTAAPGTTSGKTGTPSPVIAGTTFTNLWVAAVDTLWNIVPTNATIHFTSSDTNATLPANSPLGATGLKTNLTLTFKTAGTQTVAAVDFADATKTNTSAAVSVTTGPLAKLQVL